MISINDKKTSNISCLGIQQPNNQVKLPIVVTNTQQDSFVSKQSQKKTPSPSNNILVAVGGLAIIAGAIFAVVKFKKGKGPTAKVVKDIVSDISKAEREFSTPVKNKEKRASSHETKKIHYGGGGSSRRFGNTHGNLDVEIDILKQEHAKLERQYNIEKESIQDLFNKIFQTIKPKNEEIAKEAIPQLVTHAKKMNISIENFNSYLEQITLENKDFAIKEGIPLIAENMGKIVLELKNSEKSHELLGVLNPGNKTSLALLLDKTKVLNIQNINDFSSTLRAINSKNSHILFGDIVPNIEKNPNNFKWLDGWCLEEFLDLFKQENKNDILNNILPNVIKKFESSKIKNDSADVLTALKTIKPKDSKFVFEDLWPSLVANAERYKIQNSDQLLGYIDAIKPQNKEFALKEAMPILIQYVNKLQLADGYKMIKTLKQMTPENKDCLTLIAENVDKISSYNPDRLDKLLSLGKEGILEELGKG